ncbi:MAG: hypothetical protein NW224_30240, partial [Leptolyngbyaceae cyanobacterium bins.302]|nr:hypothetical protein [Leptolyngbyaceae cyanobacterium bins.302]
PQPQSPERSRHSRKFWVTVSIPASWVLLVSAAILQDKCKVWLRSQLTTYYINFFLDNVLI